MLRQAARPLSQRTHQAGGANFKGVYEEISMSRILRVLTREETPSGEKGKKEKRRRPSDVCELR